MYLHRRHSVLVSIKRDTVLVKIFLCQVRSTGFEQKRPCRSSVFLLFSECVQSCQHVSGCTGQVFLVFFFFAYRSVKDQTSQGVSEHQNFVFFLLCLYFLPFSDQSKSLSSVKLQFLQVCDCGGSCVCVSPFLPFFFCPAIVAVHAAVD